MKASAASAPKASAPANAPAVLAAAKPPVAERVPSAALSAPAAVQGVLQSPGEPLDDATAKFMGRRFGQDFSTVRVHAGPQAAQSAQAVGAQAYTFGRDIVFGGGRYAPQSRAGRRLLAHELAHVVQQRAAPLPKQIRIDERDGPEGAADLASDAVLSGRRMPPLPRMQAVLGLQRDKSDKKAGRASSHAGAGYTALPGIEESAGRDPDVLRKLDQFTVIEVGGGDWCRGCVLMRQDLSDLAKEMTAAAPKLRFKVYSVNVDDDANEAAGDKLRSITGDKTSIPQTFVYSEHRLLQTFSGYQDGRDYIGEIKTLHESESSRGVFKGMKYGALAGAGAGLVTGLIVGAAAGGGGGAALGGLIGTLGGGAIGLGIGAALGEGLNKDIGTAPLSEERKKQVREYVFGGTATDGKKSGGIHASGRIVGDSDSDDLARDAVELWLADPAGFALTAADRRLLVLEMQTGFLSRADQRGILKILENSTDADILRIFTEVGSLTSDQRSTMVSMADLQSRFGGDERTMLENILQRLRGKFPIAPKDQPTKGHLIDNPEVKSRMKSAYERTQKFVKYGEIAGAFFRLDAGGLGYQEKEFPGTTSHMNEVIAAARAGKYSNYEPVEGSFHTHPLIQNEAGRPAPSATDLNSAVYNPALGSEHYVIDPWVVHLITADGALSDMGRVETLLGVTPPPVPKGQQSTLELG